MERPYQVQVDVFEGPLDLLLQLIEKNKLSISEISLSRVTDQFLSYVEAKNTVPLEELSGFLSVAAKLILIKSRSLLPTLLFSGEEEASIEDLQLQLELYALFKEKAKEVEKLISSGGQVFVRDRYLGLEKVYFPPEGVEAQDLAATLKAFLGDLETLELLPEETLEKILSLEKRIQEIGELIAAKGKLAFSQMLSDDSNREEKIVSFLALLELVKQQLVWVEQHSHFEEMNIQKI